MAAARRVTRPPRVPGFIPKREYIGKRHVGWSMIPWQHAMYYGCKVCGGDPELGRLAAAFMCSGLVYL